VAVFTLRRKKSKVLLSPLFRLKAVLPNPGANVALIEHLKHIDGPSVASADDSGAAATSNVMGDAAAGFSQLVLTNSATSASAIVLELFFIHLITRILSTLLVYGLTRKRGTVGHARRYFREQCHAGAMY
jgi:hypothetical protein